MNAGGVQHPKPAAQTCPQCREVYDDWVWDDELGDWEADFEWWWHKVSGHMFLCSRHCWLTVHREHCGSGVPCAGSSS